MKRLNLTELSETLENDILDKMIEMSLGRPISKEWLDIVDNLNDLQIIQLSSRVTYLQNENEDTRKLSISNDEKLAKSIRESLREKM